MTELVIVRHGESTANRDNTYTGWSDVPLTDVGVAQAQHAGKRLREAGITFDAVHTSVLKRAIVTANIILNEIDQLWLPEYKTWRLNERHYGALRGQNKDETRRLYGKAQVQQWRRSFYTVPPLLDPSELSNDRRYTKYGPAVEPRAESLKMAYDRIMPYWIDVVAPQLLAGHNQLIVAHGSTLRALIKYLEHISDAGIDGVEVANGVPIRYRLDDQLRVIGKDEL
ncbi:2,3-bisphosphoglycerate-dependent phosphoglycerate mutase [Lactiplantibacillus fabifermentans]|uniref:2,3-bisphosphoglycerate-dependent phosphoglycerate mutase n=2 Tax=Lactiplantibacillus fabifermentans TaxID=483011 RepID=A0A0R2NFU5_9LACO|nr:2,3-diphosphoglycerate-dependent phosphoglycerate mutase [Lactiplantibacillus fabifermentans]ETY75202.1 phosphoglycerate mutase [Lactiplantibacillus fabifermentans T30PCM01]KRO22515.1 phosphoglycerate mutase [Lactiplantibacillus fabifermentans DSM 21115]